MDQSKNNMLSNSPFTNDERDESDIDVYLENRADGIDNYRHVVDEILIRERYQYKVDAPCSRMLACCLLGVDHHA